MRRKQWIRTALVLVLFVASMGYIINRESKEDSMLYSRSIIVLKNIPKRVFDEEVIEEKVEAVKTDTDSVPKENITTNHVEPLSTIKKYKLKVPQSIQETPYYCVPASLQMVLKYHGINMTQKELAKEMNTLPGNGTEYVDLARVANKYLFNNENVGSSDPGYHVQTLPIGYMTDSDRSLLEERVKINIETKDPTFIAIDNKSMYSNVSAANHLIVVVGYNEDVNTGKLVSYIFIDPSYVVNDDVHGGLKVVAAEKMYQAIYKNEEPGYIY